MQHIKNFIKTPPKTPEQLELQKKHNVMFLYSETGKEWYDCQSEFNADTIKLAYDVDGVIRSIASNNDVSTLWPDGLSVVEVANTTANRRANISGDWVFDGKAVKPRVYTLEEQSTRAEAKRAVLLAAAAKVIAPLLDAVELGMATESEIAELAEWKRYRVTLMRVDVNNPVWPEAPHVA